MSRHNGTTISEIVQIREETLQVKILSGGNGAGGSVELACRAEGGRKRGAVVIDGQELRAVIEALQEAERRLEEE